MLHEIFTLETGVHLRVQVAGKLCEVHHPMHFKGDVEQELAAFNEVLVEGMKQSYVS